MSDDLPPRAAASCIWVPCRSDSCPETSQTACRRLGGWGVAQPGQSQGGWPGFPRSRVGQAEKAQGTGSGTVTAGAFDFQGTIRGRLSLGLAHAASVLLSLRDMDREGWHSAAQNDISKTKNGTVSSSRPSVIPCASCGIETFREIAELGVTLSPASGPHLGLLPLLGALVGERQRLWCRTQCRCIDTCAVLGE